VPAYLEESYARPITCYERVMVVPYCVIRTGHYIRVADSVQGGDIQTAWHKGTGANLTQLSIARCQHVTVQAYRLASNVCVMRKPLLTD
jgi:hypothetical protein